ncbi:MAG: ARPP-1 family domain-containing protein [Planctomycetota bacterium]|jgi:hypothetical protein
MSGRNAKLCAFVLLCAALCACQEKPGGEGSRPADGDATLVASPDAKPKGAPEAAAAIPASVAAPVQGALPSTGNAALDAALGPFRLGPPVCAGNLAVVPILSAASRKADASYLTLAEALGEKLVSIEELKGGGSVPTLQMTSSAPRPVLIPFGAIVTGGKQDRMVRDDIVLRPGERRKVAVYCIEQGRWSAGAVGQAFAWSANYASNSVRIASNLKSSQTVIWESVAAQNYALDNSVVTANFQGNFETKAFKDGSAELDPAREAIEAREDVCGVVAIVNGEVTGAEICGSSPATWWTLRPQGTRRR